MIEAFKFKNNVKKSLIDNFIKEYCVDCDSMFHTSDSFRKLSVDEQLEQFKEKLLLLLKFAYKNDLRVNLCRTKMKQKPCDFTEFSIVVPNEYSNIITYTSDGEEDDDPLIEIIFTIQKVNPDAFIETVDEFGESLFRGVCAEIWVSYGFNGWASVGLEADNGASIMFEYESQPQSYIKTVDEGMVLSTDVCKALEEIFQDIVKQIKADKKWHSWFILQGIDIDEVFLWKLY